MSIIKYNNKTINKLEYNTSEVNKMYYNSDVCYGGDGGSPEPPTPPVPFSGKWLATYVGGTTSSGMCGSSSAITQNEVNLTDLTSVEIGDCVTSIGFRAFKQATSLTSVTMADNVTLISGETFTSCTALTSVNLSTGLTTISGSSFQNCPSLTSVTIPASVQRIGSRVFERCSGLTSVIVLATTPPSLASYVFDNTNDCPIYVPAASVSTYKSTSGWSTYASRIQAIGGGENPNSGSNPNIGGIDDEDLPPDN